MDVVAAEHRQVVRSHRERLERCARVDDDERIEDRLLVELPPRALPDRRDVRAGRKPFAAHDRLRRAGRRAHDVRTRDRFLERIERTRAELGGDLVGLRAVASGDANLLERARVRKRPGV